MRASFWFAFADICHAQGVRDWRNDEWNRKAQAAYEAGLSKHGEEWMPPGYVRALYNLAQIHSSRGICLTDDQHLEQALPLYRAVVQLCSWGRDGWLFGYANMMLGHTLRILGEKETGTARLEEALKAYSFAFSEVNQQRQLDWYRSLLFGRAECLRLIGERETGSARLQEAIPVYEVLLALYDASTADLHRGTEEKLNQVRAAIRNRSAASTAGA